MLNHASTTSPIIRASFFRTSALFYIRTTHAGNLPFVLFAILTSKSITGTSVNTPTVVARAAGEVVPNSAIATATAIVLIRMANRRLLAAAPQDFHLGPC